VRRLLIAGLVVVLLLVGVAVAALVALERIDWNEYKAPIAEAAFDATGRRLDLDGDLDLQIGLTPGVKLASVTFENADWGSRPEMATLENLVVRFRLLPLLSGQLVVSRVELDGLDLLLETAEDGTANWDFSAAAPPGPEATPAEREGEQQGEPEEESAPLATFLHHARIENAVVVIRDGVTGEEQRFAIARLVASSDGADTPLHLDLQAEYGVEPIRISGDVEGIPGLMAGGPLQLDLTIEAGGASLGVSGEIGQPLEGAGLDLDIAGNADRLGRLGGVARADLPDLGPVRLGLKVKGGGDAYAIRGLELAVGGSGIGGDVDVALGGPRPRIDAKLVALKLDLADFSAPKSETPPVSARPQASEGSASKPRRTPVFSDDPLPLEALTAVDASLNLEADELKSGDLVVSGLGVGLRLEAGVLDVDRFTADVAGGRIDLVVGLDASQTNPRLTLVGQARGVEVGQLARSQGSDVISGGPLDLDLDLVGSGRSLHGIVSTLAGHVKVEMGKATVHDETVGMVLSDLEGVLHGEAGSTTAELACIFAKFDVERGVARPDGFVIDFSSIALFGDGKIHLRNETMNLKFDRQSLGVSASGVLPPFKIKGPLDAPEAEVDATALAGMVVDLGASLLGDKKDDRERAPDRPRPVGCVQLLARYEQDQAERGSSADVGRRTADDLGDKAGKSGKKLFKKMKGLFGK
jgi:uncharacterized protein involved in outer membrane biogenesis